MSESKGCSSGWGVCTIYPSGGRCLHPDRAAEGRGCRKCLDLSPGAGTGSRPACKRRPQVEGLLHQVAELQEVVRRLCSIREAEKELDSWFHAQSAVDPQPTDTQPKTPPSAHTEGRGPIMQKNGSLQWQGPAGGRDFFQSLRCPCRTASLLCTLKRKGLSH